MALVVGGVGSCDGLVVGRIGCGCCRAEIGIGSCNGQVVVSVGQGKVLGSVGVGPGDSLLVGSMRFGVSGLGSRNRGVVDSLSLGNSDLCGGAGFLDRGGGLWQGEP